LIAIKEAAQLHKRYGQLDYPIDIEDVAKKEGLKVIDWPLLSPVNEVKRGNWIGIREGLSSEWRRWDIAHALGHHLLHHGNQLLVPSSHQAETRAGSRRIRYPFPYA